MSDAATKLLRTTAAVSSSTAAGRFIPLPRAASTEQNRLNQVFQLRGLERSPVIGTREFGIKCEVLFNYARAQGDGCERDRGSFRVVGIPHRQVELTAEGVESLQIYIGRLRRIAADAVQQHKLPVTGCGADVDGLPHLVQGSHAGRDDKWHALARDVRDKPEIGQLAGRNLVRGRIQPLESVRAFLIEHTRQEQNVSCGCMRDQR